MGDANGKGLTSSKSWGNASFFTTAFMESGGKRGVFDAILSATVTP